MLAITGTLHVYLVTHKSLKFPTPNNLPSSFAVGNFMTTVCILLVICPMDWLEKKSNPATSLLGLYPQEIIKMRKGPTCTKIFIVALFAVAKNWKSRRSPSIGEWLNKLWYMNIMEYYFAIRNDEQEDFREAWKDLYELMLRERRRTRRILYTATTTVCEDFFW